MDFEIIEHPADVEFRAWGKTLEEVFANCARALISIILDPSNAAPREHWTLHAEGGNLESLLVNWLNEVLYYVDTRWLVFESFAVEFHDEFHLACQARGEQRILERHPVRVSVKAVTYHQLRLSKEGENWMAEVFVDV